MKISIVFTLLALFLFPASGFAGELDFCDAFPPGIRCVAVISPASFPNQKKIEGIIRQMETHGIKIKAGKYLFRPQGSKAKRASVEERCEDFTRAWFDPEIDLILCTRGGSGSEELLPVLDWEAMRRRPEMLLVGFSNITCLTGAMLRQGAGHPFAGPNLGRLSSITRESRESFRRGLAGEAQLPFRLKVIRPGDCEGGIYAGHLGLLAILDARPEHRFVPDDRIVFIECINLTPQQMEKDWERLLKSGFFKKVQGVVFGDFSQIPPASAAVLRKKFAGTLSCPVYYGFPYGHEKGNYTLDFFGKASIRNNVLTIVPGDLFQRQKTVQNKRTKESCGFLHRIIYYERKKQNDH